MLHMRRPLLQQHQTECQATSYYLSAWIAITVICAGHYNYLHLNHMSIAVGSVQLGLEVVSQLSCCCIESMYARITWNMCVVCMTYIKAKPTTLNFCCRYTVICLTLLTLQVILLHTITLPTSALTGTSSSPVTTSTRPLSPMCGSWMGYQWNMMEESLPSTMVMDLSLSWMSVKVDMLREKLCCNAVWSLQVDHKFVGNITYLQCCVNLTSGVQVSGKYYPFDPLGEQHT